MEEFLVLAGAGAGLWLFTMGIAGACELWERQGESERNKIKSRCRSCNSDNGIHEVKPNNTERITQRKEKSNG